MKTVLVLKLQILLLLGLQASYSHAQINYNDFKYYYIFQSKLIDVRTQNQVISYEMSSPFRPIYNKTNHTLSLYGNNIVTINDEGKFINAFPTWGVAFSPDLKTILYVKGGDIWVANVNYQTGKSYNDKQLTQLGIFPSDVKVINWFENNVIFGIQPKYQINIVSGEISEVEKYRNEIRFNPYVGNYLGDNYPGNHVSPNRRYCIVANREQPSSILDMKNLSIKNINISFYESDCSWLSDSIALVLTKIDEKFQFYKLDCNTGKATNVLADIPESFVSERFHYETTYYERNVPKNISPNSTYIMLPFYDKDFDVQDRLHDNAELMIFNLKNNQEVIKSEVRFNAYDGNSGYYEWISDDSFIYSKAGNISSQGTWIYNLKKREHKRITPFILQNAIVLPDAGKILFIANRYLYKMDINGNNLEQISKEQISGGLVNSFYLSPFNTLVIISK